MKEINERKIELENEIKKTIIEIYLIKEKKEEIKSILKEKEKYLQNINASINEIQYLKSIEDK
jgi:hypothetical protein